MKTITVQFQAWYYTDVEVPENWTPTPENINDLRTQAWAQADFEEASSREAWEATVGTMGDESFEMD